MLGRLRFTSICRNFRVNALRGVGTRFLSEHVKTSTGIVGIEVEPNYREVLTGLYNEILEVSKGMPEHAFYRQHLEQDAKAHLAVLETATDVRPSSSFFCTPSLILNQCETTKRCLT